MKPLIS